MQELEKIEGRVKAKACNIPEHKTCLRNDATRLLAAVKELTRMADRWSIMAGTSGLLSTGDKEFLEASANSIRTTINEALGES